MSGLDWWEISVAGRYTYGNAISRASAEVQAERLRERFGVEVTVIPHEYGEQGEVIADKQRSISDGKG